MICRAILPTSGPSKHARSPIELFCAGVVLGVEARAMLLGPLAALSLGRGFATVHKGRQPHDAEGRLVTRTTPPDDKHRASSLSSDAVFVGAIAQGGCCAHGA